MNVGMRNGLAMAAAMACGAAWACTTMIATPGATDSGAMFVAHSDDGHLSDARLMRVPAATHLPGSMRPVFYDAVSMGELPQYASFEYRRYAGSARGPDYEMPGAPQTEPIGHIPQVEQTYAYFDGNYGIMNERQLMFGECTNGSKTDNAQPGPDRLFYSAELARVALERCATAAEAVELIGELIDTYGLYGTGETLPVADPKEAWVIEMAPGPEGVPGLWAAQKVPDGEMFVAANQFRIREIDPANPDQRIGRHVHAAAQAQGWWKPEDGPLDWLRTVSMGEYNHPYYSLRRVWRVLDRVAPSLGLGAWVEDGFTREYPFTVKPDRKLSRQDVIDLYRDHYEGTEFDMTQGEAAGPFGCPYRYLGEYDASGDAADPTIPRAGAWERPLSVYYCTYVYVCEGRSWLPDPIGGILWFGNAKPAQTCMTPFYAGVRSIPESYRTCDARVYTRDSAYWAFNFVENWAALNYAGIFPEIVARRDELEKAAFESIEQADEAALALHRQEPEQALYWLTSFCNERATETFQAWQQLGDRLVAEFADGGINHPGRLNGKIGYPEAWRMKTSWPTGPTRYERPEAAPESAAEAP
jgi:dipeptidase